MIQTTFQLKEAPILLFTENVVEKFKAFGFQTIEVSDGTDLEAIGKAIEEAKG